MTPGGQSVSVGLLLRRHWALFVLLLIGGALRLALMLAYRPAFLFPDSIRYLRFANPLVPDTLRPSGFSIVLAGLSNTHRLSAIALTQHVLGLLLFVATYAVVMRRTGRRWPALLAAAPVALSSLQLTVEHYVLSDALFDTAVGAGVLALVWSSRLTWRAAAVGGLAWGIAATLRGQGWLLAVLVVVLVLLRRDKLTATATFVVVLAMPVAAYVGWYHQENGAFAITGSSGLFLYSRVAPMATCQGLHLTVAEHRLCDPKPPARRPNQVYYAFSPKSPAYGLQTEHDGVLVSFAKAWILAHPVTYGVSVLQQTGYYFRPPQYESVDNVRCVWFRLPAPHRGLCPVTPDRPDMAGYPVVQARFAHPTAANVLARAGNYLIVPGPLLAILGLFSLVLVALPRRFVGVRRLTQDGAFCAVTALGLLLITSAAAYLDPRLGLPILTLLPLGAALSYGALRNRPTVTAPQARPVRSAGMTDDPPEQRHARTC